MPNEQTAEVEKPEPQQTATVEGTKVEPDPASKPEPEQEDSTAGDELAKWKKFSRDNEKQSKANYKLYEQSQKELAEANRRVSVLELQRRHPQLTDDVMSLCSETDPDKITEWGEKYAQLNPINAAATPDTPPADDGPSAPTFGDRRDDGGKYRGATRTEEDGRKRAREIIARKRGK
ncbi:hypothetical protein [Bifidobacterium tissieri]|uniref:Uncharacterized protein n=1 Tax=Bifidobacterium tissieri TaxID=1630162 RepID=A0A5M9ZVK1_9BIFI|nr:hypothetical protein [Bifidobacterium tissieri]KAA8829331.1 hypothetical protein EM849_11025 [Bifidobacterium tissieri]KAA8831644.1 hypothetical protein EMO89_02665 [Bifidobacterium tissieri]